MNHPGTHSRPRPGCSPHHCMGPTLAQSTLVHPSAIHPLGVHQIRPEGIAPKPTSYVDDGDGALHQNAPLVIVADHAWYHLRRMKQV